MRCRPRGDLRQLAGRGAAEGAVRRCDARRLRRLLARRAGGGGRAARLSRHDTAQGGCRFLRPPARRTRRRSYGDRRGDPRKPGTDPSRPGDRAGSLLAAIDRTITGAGARLLAADLAAPLTDRDAIEARLDLVAWFDEDGALRDGLRAAAAQPPRYRPRARPAGGGARRPARSRPAARRARRRRGCCTNGWRGPDRAGRCSPSCCRSLARPRRAGRPAGPRAGAVAADRRGRRAAISPRAMTPRSTRCARPAARAARRSPRSRRAIAARPASPH